MVLTNLVSAVILVLMIGAVVFGLSRVFRTYLRYRGLPLCTWMRSRRLAYR